MHWEFFSGQQANVYEIIKNFVTNMQVVMVLSSEIEQENILFESHPSRHRRRKSEEDIPYKLAAFFSNDL